MIRISNLNKVYSIPYGEIPALKNINLTTPIDPFMMSIGQRFSEICQLSWNGRLWRERCEGFERE